MEFVTIFSGVIAKQVIKYKIIGERFSYQMIVMNKSEICERHIRVGIRLTGHLALNCKQNNTAIQNQVSSD